jgi:hypothetical protein
MKTIVKMIGAVLMQAVMPCFAADAEVKISQVTKTFAEVIINGTSKGKREINGGPSLKEFASSLAAEFGVRTFNVSVDGEAVRTQAQADAPVRPGSSVEVVAKDTRGSRGNDPNTEATSNEGVDGETGAMAQADGDSGDEHTPALAGDGATA